MIPSTRSILRLGCFALLALRPAQSRAQCPALARGDLPLNYAGSATAPAITACDLMTRLYAFADDSMRGRRAGTPDNVRATDYIAAEARRLGLRPGGDNGGFFQNIPMVTRNLDTTSTITVGASVLRAGHDFLITTSAMHPAELKELRLVNGGALLDTTMALNPELSDGRVVLFQPIPAGVDGGAVQRTAKGEAWVTWYNTIHNRATANAATLSPQALRNATNSTATMMLLERGAPVSLTLTVAAAEELFGGPLNRVPAGTRSKPFTLDLRYVDTPRLTRNVIAVLPGAVAKLRGEYVALGAHSDHMGIGRSALDHDSLRVFNTVSRAGAEGAASRKQTTEDDEYDRIHAQTDSVHRLRPVRFDSIFNGADDGGSGTVALLEIAESLAKGNAHPARSVLFVWHTSTEANPALAGSTWFTDHPTVALDSIVAELTVDQIGRGESTDEVGITMNEDPRHGNPDFLEVIGSRRQSSEFGKLIDRTNQTAATGLQIEYAADSAGHPEGLYCRNDQASYARHGIPVAWFTTGYNADYREVTDEPQYIDYGHMARIVKLVAATTLAVADLDHRVALDHPRPDPTAHCTQ